MQQAHRASGALPGFANGGLIDKVKASLVKYVGNSPDAMAKRGRTEQIDPAPTPPPAQAGYASGVKTKDNPAGIKFAKGGEINRAKGAIKGPGTATSDSIPILASNGEFMVKAAAVQKLGVPFMKKLNAIADGDKPNSVKPKPKLGAVPKMREGGSPEEELRKLQRQLPAPQSRALVPVQAPGTAVATTPIRQNFTMPRQFAQPPAAQLALPAPPAQPLPQVDVQRQAWQGKTGSPQADEWLKTRNQPSGAPAPAQPAAASRIGQVAGRVGGALRTAARFAAPVAGAASIATTATTPTEDYETRFGFGPSTSDSPGVNLVRDVGVRALGAASDLGNTLTGGLAGSLYRDKQAQAGQLTPADRAATSAAPAGALPQQPMAAPATTPAPAAPPAAAPAPPLGQVTRIGNSYSGQNVSGDVSFVNGQGKPRPAGGGFMSMDTSAGYQQDLRDLAAIEATKAQAAKDLAANNGGLMPTIGATGGFGLLDNQNRDRRNAAIGFSGGAKRAAMGAVDNRYAAAQQSQNDMTKARMTNTLAQEKNADTRENNRGQLGALKDKLFAETAAKSQDQKLARDKFDVDAAGANLDNESKQRLGSLQAVITDQKATPEDRKRATEMFDALMGRTKSPAKPLGYDFMPGGFDEKGNPLPPIAGNKDTGEMKAGVSGAQATPKTQYDSMKKGEKYTGADGKQYIKG